MKHIIVAGCDGATLCAFDPAALPSDFDRIVSDDPAAMMQRLRSQGRIWFRETGADGRFVFHAYVGERAPPASSGETRILVAEFPGFACPSGRLWFCGAEYAANDPERGSSFTPKGGLRRYANGGGYIQVEAGKHQLKIYVVDRNRTAVRTTSLASLLTYLYGFFLITGGLAAFFPMVIFVFGLPVKLIQYLIGHPNAGKGWHLFPIALGVLVLGALWFGIGLLLERWGRVRGGEEEPDYIVEMAAATEPWCWLSRHPPLLRHIFNGAFERRLWRADCRPAQGTNINDFIQDTCSGRRCGRY